MESEAREKVIRRTTKLELGLAVGLGMNLVAVVWFAATMAAKVDNVAVNLNEAVGEIRTFRNSVSEFAIMKYRIEQLERAEADRQRRPETRR